MADQRLGSSVVCGEKWAGFLGEVLQAEGQSSIFRSSVCLDIQLLALLSTRGGRDCFRRRSLRPLCLFVFMFVLE